MDLLATIRRLLLAAIILLFVGFVATSSTHTMGGAFSQVSTIQPVSMRATSSSRTMSLLVSVTPLTIRLVFVNSRAESERALVPRSAAHRRIEMRVGEIVGLAEPSVVAHHLPTALVG
jgi:hypothetical protein